MSYSTPTSVVLTVVFAITAAGYLLFALRGRTNAVSRISDVLHLLMSIAMLAIPWGWGSVVAPPVAQIVVFSLATAFYLVLLVGGDRVGAHEHHGPGGSARLVVGYHVVMMAAMVVMGAMMTGMHPAAGSSMPGMSMGGSGGRMSGGMAPGWSAVSWLLAVVFAVATLWLIVRLVGALRARAGRLAVADAALLTLMSAGMALAFVPGS